MTTFDSGMFPSWLSFVLVALSVFGSVLMQIKPWVHENLMERD